MISYEQNAFNDLKIIAGGYLEGLTKKKANKILADRAKRINELNLSSKIFRGFELTEQYLFEDVLSYHLEKKHDLENSLLDVGLFGIAWDKIEQKI